MRLSSKSQMNLTSLPFIDKYLHMAAKTSTRQIEIFNSKSQFGKRAVHGGSERASDRKYKRPLSTKDFLHVVLRSSKAKGSHSFRNPKNLKKIETILRNQAKLSRITLDRFSINSNHLHLLISFKRREFYFQFVRAVSGLIARLVLRSERGPAFDSLSKTKSSELTKSARKTAASDRSTETQEITKTVAGFWDARPFSRIVKWGKSYFTLARYILRNELEALGFIKYQRGPRMDFFLRQGYFASS